MAWGTVRTINTKFTRLLVVCLTFSYTVWGVQLVGNISYIIQHRMERVISENNAKIPFSVFDLFFVAESGTLDCLG